MSILQYNAFTIFKHRIRVHVAFAVKSKVKNQSIIVSLCRDEIVTKEYIVMT